MQRLFVMFPDRAPGVGLLLLRVQIAVVLVACALQAPGSALLVQMASWAGAVLLVAGWLTPLGSALAVLVLVLEQQGLLLGLPVCLLLVGPGAYGVDALLFGRRVVSAAPDDTPKE